MSCCLDSHISRTTPVDGEMDRLRILTTSDFGHVAHGLSQIPDFKQEPSPPHYIIKQEIPSNGQFVVKTELPDPQYTHDPNLQYPKQNFKNCVALPIPLPPTPTEDTSEKLIVGSTSQFLPDCSNKNLFKCVIYVKGDTSMLQRVEFFIDYETTEKLFDCNKLVKTSAPYEIIQNFLNETNVKILLFFKNKKIPTELILPVSVDSTKSGLVCSGPETAVDYPIDVAESQRKISELIRFLQAPPSQQVTADSRTNKVIFQSDFIQAAPTVWPKSAPTSPLSPGSPSDNRIIRSASSSPIRHQTVLPNPCCRQKTINRSSSINQEPILSNQNSMDGEPIAKRRPAPLTSMGTLGIQNGATRFTPISVPDSPNYSSMPFERISNDPLPMNHQEVQIGMLPEPITGMRLPSDNGQSILITSSNGSSPTKVQHIVVRENIKQEYFVSENSTDITIAANNSNLLNNNSDHIRNQRTGRKCRKVYGVNNRYQWCTACRWKKACRRFPN